MSGKIAVAGYRWKHTGRISTKPEIAAKCFAVIERRDEHVTPAAVLDYARPRDSALHPEFEWNDRIAAEKYRLQHAGHIIRSLEIVVEGSGGEETVTRAYVSIQGEVDEDGSIEPQSVYVRASRAFSAQDTREQVLAQASEELRWFREKYKKYTEFAPVIASIEKVLRIKG